MSSDIKAVPPSPSQERANQVLKFIGKPVARSFVPVEGGVDRERAAQVIDIKRPPINTSITARQVVATATGAQEEALTAKYQEIAKKQVASLFPNLGSARQDMVADAIAGILAERDLATKTA